MNKVKWGATIILIQGFAMEIAPILFALSGIVNAENTADSIVRYKFVVPFFSENMELLLVSGLVFGVTRIIGAAALLKDRMWGFVLSLINCIVSMILLVFLLPAGALDGILACIALILLLSGYFGKRSVSERLQVGSE